MLLRTPVDLGFAIRDRRRKLNLSQGELAKRVGVSRKWIIDAEKGKPLASVGLILRTLDMLGLRLALDEWPARSKDGAEPAAIPSVDIDRLLDSARKKG